MMFIRSVVIDDIDWNILESIRTRFNNASGEFDQKFSKPQSPLGLIQLGGLGIFDQAGNEVTKVVEHPYTDAVGNIFFISPIGPTLQDFWRNPTKGHWLDFARLPASPDGSLKYPPHIHNRFRTKDTSGGDAVLGVPAAFYFLQGSANIFLAHAGKVEQYEVGPGDLVSVPSYMYHGFSVNPGKDAIWIAIQKTQIEIEPPRPQDRFGGKYNTNPSPEWVNRRFGSWMTEPVGVR